MKPGGAKKIASAEGNERTRGLRRVTAMKRWICAAMLLAIGLSVAETARAESWMFERSYYSHKPETPVQVGRRARGGPYYSRPQGAYFNGGFRRLRSTINVGGYVYDNLNLFESWAQTGGQY